MKKIFTAGIAVLGSIMLGEYLSPYQSTRDSLQFHNVPTAKGFAKDPWNYEVKRELLEQDGKTYQAIYLVNKEQGFHKKINEEGCTCGVKNSIDDFFENSKNWIQEKIEKLKE